jgi:hypothetical protein
MLQRYAVAFGAGCAAAFLFAVSAQASLLAMLLAYLAPLPIMIATLGWGLDAGAIAAAVSVAGLTLIAEPLSGLLFAGSVAFPAWLLAAFATTPLARYLPRRFASLPPYPTIGAVVALAAVIGMIGAATVLTAVIVIFHGYAEGAKSVTDALAAMATEALDDPGNGEAAKAFAQMLVRIGPMAVAGSTLLMLCVNLYAAARSVQLSHGLKRSWLDLPTSLWVPAPLAVVGIAAAAAAFGLPAPGSQYAGAVAGALGTAFVFQGLAVAHALSRGLKLRILMLVALYACCILRAKYTLPALALLGVIDAFSRLRVRAAALPAPKPTLQK